MERADTAKRRLCSQRLLPSYPAFTGSAKRTAISRCRSEEHTSELQSQSNLVCRLLLEKKKKNSNTHFFEISTAANTFYVWSKTPISTVNSIPWSSVVSKPITYKTCIQASVIDDDSDQL